MQALEANLRALRGPILVTGASGFIGANLVKMIAAATEQPQQTVTNILDALGAAIQKATENGSTVITGFGRFTAKTRAARTARNPRTGEPVEVPAKTTLSFKPSKPKA